MDLREKIARAVNSLRWWLVAKLAGRRSVMMNCGIDGTAYTASEGFIDNVEFVGNGPWAINPRKP